MYLKNILNHLNKSSTNKLHVPNNKYVLLLKLTTNKEFYFLSTQVQNIFTGHLSLFCTIIVSIGFYYFF